VLVPGPALVAGAGVAGRESQGGFENHRLPGKTPVSEHAVSLPAPLELGHCPIVTLQSCRLVRLGRARPHDCQPAVRTLPAGTEATRQVCTPYKEIRRPRPRAFSQHHESAPGYRTLNGTQMYGAGGTERGPLRGAEAKVFSD